MIFSPLARLSLLILLFAVTTGWGVIGHRRAGSLQNQIASISAERDHATATAQACSASVQQLSELAEQRAREAMQARAAAHTRAQQHNRRADEALAAPAAVPGDDYASARHRVDAWLNERGR